MWLGRQFNKYVVIERLGNGVEIKDYAEDLGT